MSKQQWEIWIDRGGTFTDIVARDPNGRIITRKLLSDNPEHYSDAAIQGIRDVLQLKPNEKFPEHLISSIKMGTTIATNTLLERKGPPVALAITEGFRDALRIGYQNRPKLFELNIVLPAQLYNQVIEIKERIDAQGKVLQVLDENLTQQSLSQVYSAGYRAIAIVLMHAYRYPHHEKKIMALAQQIGFTQISVSHQVAPVVKLISRGDTTVVDAYLSPVLSQYIQQLRKTLGQIPLFFLQSNGGLVNATEFQGKDSIFSGPAGGVVGMVKTAKSAGFDKIIGFDMGGTSTDISHFAGEYERTYSWEIAGVRLRAPMMLIETIASGGGSILHFDGQRYSVGPDSAGANPGPACYRRNGPLTITDCNVQVGKIQADFFPKVFGASGNQSIDVEWVHKKFKELAIKIEQATGHARTAEQVAEGFLQIAVENMVNAIKKISLNRGYKINEYLLNCFGGAAGQHVCQVADALDIQKILVHPYAGVLSAYGIGMAEIRVIKQQSIEKLLTSSLLLNLKKIFQSLEPENLAQQYLVIRKIHLHYQDSDTALVVDFGDLKTIKQSFYREHQNRFGFHSKRKAIFVESVSVETICQSTPVKEMEVLVQSKRNQEAITPLTVVKVFMQGHFVNTPIYLRANLIPGDCIRGSAIICEDHTTTVIEPGWQAELTPKKHLLLSRYQPLTQKKTLSTQADPVMLEVFNNRFMNIAEQMGEVLRNTASSVNIKERLDFSCAIFDNQGDLVANAPHIPVHLGSMSESVKNVLKQFKNSMHADDAFVLNDPYHGGTHLPDITVIQPVFDDAGKELLFLVGSRGHHADIGGITPGSVPAKSKIIEEEGVLIKNFQILNRGRFSEKATCELLQNAPYPARNPQQNLEDLKAQIAANQYGIHALNKLNKEFSLKVVQAYMQHVQNNAKHSVEKLLTRLSEGNFNYYLDDHSKIAVNVTIHRNQKRILFDFTGSAAQHPGNFNAPKAICYAAVMYVIRCLIAENIPLNSGFFAVIEIIIPDGGILNPHYPAAVVAGNVETSQCIVDTLLGAMKIVAASQGTCNNFTFGNDRYQYYETICGGAGAGPGFHGASAVHTHMTNTYLTDPEVLEQRFPVILEAFSIRHGSGGEGKYHGGNGVIRRIRFLEKMTANIISSHRIIPPYGLCGGGPGQVGRNWVQRADGKIEELASSATVYMEPGDVFIIETPGGGGYQSSGIKTD